MDAHQNNPSFRTQRPRNIPLPTVPLTRTPVPVNDLIPILVITTLSQMEIDSTELRPRIAQNAPPLLLPCIFIFIFIRFITSGKEYITFILAARSWSCARVFEADGSRVVVSMRSWLGEDCLRELG